MKNLPGIFKLPRGAELLSHIDREVFEQVMGADREFGQAIEEYATLQDISDQENERGDAESHLEMIW